MTKSDLPTLLPEKLCELLAGTVSPIQRVLGGVTAGDLVEEVARRLCGPPADGDVVDASREVLDMGK